MTPDQLHHPSIAKADMFNLTGRPQSTDFQINKVVVAVEGRAVHRAADTEVGIGMSGKKSHDRDGRELDGTKMRAKDDPKVDEVDKAVAVASTSDSESNPPQVLT